MLIYFENFWSHVIWCSTECSGGAGPGYSLLTHTKVSNLDMTLPVQEYVVQLEISVDDLVRVEEHQTQSNLSSVELSLSSRELAGVIEVEHEVSP